MHGTEAALNGKNPPSRPQWLRRVTSGLLFVLLAAFVWMHWDQEAFLVWKQGVHPLLFFSMMAVLPAVGFPVTPLYVLAGLTFGTAVGLIGTWLAIAANLSLCFWIARSGMRPRLKRWISGSRFQLPEAPRHKQLGFTVLLRLTPGVPSFLKSYLLALAGVSFRVYLPVSLGIGGSFASMLVLLGESVLEPEFDPWKMGVVVMLLLLLSGGVAWWQRKQWIGTR